MMTVRFDTQQVVDLWAVTRPPLTIDALPAPPQTEAVVIQPDGAMQPLGDFDFGSPSDSWGSPPLPLPDDDDLVALVSASMANGQEQRPSRAFFDPQFIADIVESVLQEVRHDTRVARIFTPQRCKQFADLMQAAFLLAVATLRANANTALADNLKLLRDWKKPVPARASVQDPGQWADIGEEVAVQAAVSIVRSFSQAVFPSDATSVKTSLAAAVMPVLHLATKSEVVLPTIYNPLTSFPRVTSANQTMPLSTTTTPTQGGGDQPYALLLGLLIGGNQTAAAAAAPARHLLVAFGPCSNGREYRNLVYAMHHLKPPQVDDDMVAETVETIDSGTIEPLPPAPSQQQQPPPPPPQPLTPMTPQAAPPESSPPRSLSPPPSVPGARKRPAEEAGLPVSLPQRPEKRPRLMGVWRPPIVNATGTVFLPRSAPLRALLLAFRALSNFDCDRVLANSVSAPATVASLVETARRSHTDLYQLWNAEGQQALTCARLFLRAFVFLDSEARDSSGVCALIYGQPTPPTTPPPEWLAGGDFADPMALIMTDTLQQQQQQQQPTTHHDATAVWPTARCELLDSYVHFKQTQQHPTIVGFRDHFLFGRQDSSCAVVADVLNHWRHFVEEEAPKLLRGARPAFALASFQLYVILVAIFDLHADHQSYVGDTDDGVYGLAKLRLSHFGLSDD